MAKSDGTYLKEIAKIERQQLIILDDFGLQAMDNQNRIAVFSTFVQQKKTEKIFLINTCLDVAYVSSGFLLLKKSKEINAQQSV